MNRKTLLPARLFVIVMAITASVALADYTIDWYTIDGGGDMWCTGGTFELSSTIGQHDANPTAMTGGGFELTGGFWVVGVGSGPAGPGDCDGDGDVDLDDFNTFVSCMDGPDSGLASGCACCDFEDDSDVDLADFAEFQAAFTGALP